MSIATITPQELGEICQRSDKLTLIDVRTPREFQEVHLVAASNWPLDKLDPAEVMKYRNGSADDPLYVICRSGNRSRQACEKLVAAGHANVVTVDGGTLACVEA